MPYTLADQRVLDGEFPLCAERGVGVVVGAVFASGILATGPVEGATYAYAEATPEVLADVGAIEAVCQRHDVPMAAAALQFPLAPSARGLGDPRRVRRPSTWSATSRRCGSTFPVALWADLKSEGLIRADAPTP